MMVERRGGCCISLLTCSAVTAGGRIRYYVLKIVTGSDAIGRMNGPNLEVMPTKYSLYGDILGATWGCKQRASGTLSSGVVGWRLSTRVGDGIIIVAASPHNPLSCPHGVGSAAGEG